MAAEIADIPPLAVRLAKAVIDLGSSAGLHTGLAYEKACQSFLHTTVDCNEGMASFLEKRRPIFKGE